MMTSTITMARSGTVFDTFAEAVRRRFDATLVHYGTHLFRVTPDQDLYEVYLNALPEAERQHHTCEACKDFIRRYGALVCITDDGDQTPAMWPVHLDVPRAYQGAVTALRRAVARGTVSDVFKSIMPQWGTPHCGDWTHLAVTPPSGEYLPPALLTAGQAMAVKRDDYRHLRQGLAEFRHTTVAQALTLLDADALYRGEKVIGPVRFLLDLHATLAGVTNLQRWTNLVWRAVAGAPAGFCRPRSTLVGTLLEDIEAGMSFREIKRRFDAKLNPAQYQRPQVAPKAGTIAQAEQLAVQLGLEPALHRRYARLEEIPTIWQPQQVMLPPRAGGVFGHLQPKGAVPTPWPIAMPAQNITFEKFCRTVLPFAQRMEVHVDGMMNFCGMTTAVHADARPILQWDAAEARNPVSWYVYQTGSPPERWSLVSGEWVPVTAVALQPSMWADPERFTNHGKSALLVLQGAQDVSPSGLALFPETLKTELHGVRGVIEAYSAAGHLEGADLASACGLRVGSPGVVNQVRVTTATGTALYHIDRWD